MIHIFSKSDVPSELYDSPLPLLPRYRVKSRVQIMSQVHDYNLALMNVPELWRRTRGAQAVGAVLDTGVPRHVDLKPAGGYSFVRGYSQDRNGHSTHVGGIISALADNDMGVVGVAPDAALHYCAVLGADGTGSISSIISGLRWAVDVAGAKVINMSLGLPASMPYLRKLEEACVYATNQGATLICATGNAGGAIGQPAVFDCTIAIGAVNSAKEHAEFSNHGKQIDFAAGGVGVYSTFLDDSYALLSGTSMAAPAITGMVLLIQSDHYLANGKWLTRDGVYKKLQKIAYDVGGDGFDEFTGHGIPVFQSVRWDGPDAPSVPAPAPVVSAPPVLTGDADLSPKPGDIPMPPKAPSDQGAPAPEIRPPDHKRDGCALATAMFAQVSEAVATATAAGTPMLEALAMGLEAATVTIQRVQAAQAAQAAQAESPADAP